MLLLEEELLSIKDRLCSPDSPEVPVLFGLHDDVILARVVVETRNLEELLDALAGLDFPVNPELHHGTGSVTVEFPTYAGHVVEIRNTLRRLDFDSQLLDVAGLLHFAASSS